MGVIWASACSLGMGKHADSDPASQYDVNRTKSRFPSGNDKQESVSLADDRKEADSAWDDKANVRTRSRMGQPHGGNRIPFE